jgi:hypothetical protein
MTYSKHFQLVDDVSTHFDAAVNSAGAFLQSRYVGFYAVAAAAVLELALKEVVVDFARHHHSLFGDYLASRYEKINGRIRLGNITDDHLKPFGTTFQDRFRELLKEADQLSIRESGYSVRLSYEALLICRHQFSHAGSIPETTSYADIKKGFDAGKIVMDCLAKTLNKA